MLKKTLFLLISFSFIIAFLISGCGGGSGGTIPVSTPTSVPVNPTATPVPSVTGNPTANPTYSPTQGGGSLTNLFFLHHSVGDDLITRGSVRTTINNYNSANGTGYAFWDHGYNGDGLRNPSGVQTGTNYNIPNDNTNPDGLSYLFTSTEADAQNARNLIMNNHQVIAFKSCFIALPIPNDDTLNQYKSYYLGMRSFFDQHPEKLFIIITPPPNHPNETSTDGATRSRQFANWLKSSEYLSGHRNMVCFDLFDYLADSNNVLKSDYRYAGEVNSHPNELADQTIGPIFAQFLINSSNSYRP